MLLNDSDEDTAVLLAALKNEFILVLKTFSPLLVSPSIDCFLAPKPSVNVFLKLPSGFLLPVKSSKA